MLKSVMGRNLGLFDYFVVDLRRSKKFLLNPITAAAHPNSLCDLCLSFGQRLPSVRHTDNLHSLWSIKLQIVQLDPKWTLSSKPDDSLLKVENTAIILKYQPY